MTRVNESGCANGINFSRPPRTKSLTLLRPSSVITPKLMRTSLTPSTAPTAAVISVVRRSFMGHPEIVRRIVKSTTPPDSATLSTIPSSGSAW